MHDHTVCFYLVGISDDQLRAANYHLSSSVRFMPLSSYGPAWRWNVDGPAQILTVICSGELHGRGIAKTSRETCVRYPIVGLRKFAALFSGRQLDSFWLFCREPCFWLRVAETREHPTITHCRLRSVSVDAAAASRKRTAPTHLRHEAKDVRESIRKFISGMSAASIVVFLTQYRQDEIKKAA